MAIDMDKLNAFIGRFVGDLGAAVHTGMVVIGSTSSEESWCTRASMMVSTHIHSRKP